MKNGKRRGATKVPNVILRPPPSITNPKETVASTSNTQEDEDNNNIGELEFREGSLPLRGVVLCASGRLDKATLFAYAQQLGASRSNDFTDKVTHLVTDAPGSTKYQCAVERNLPILSESWIGAIYNAWLRGETIDLNQFVAEHRLPIFSGVRLCITGMQDLETRERIATIIQEQGGVYSRSLGPSSTHLLCSDLASDKVAWAKRVNQERGKKKICIIWEEWFWDCLEFGGRWNEEPYVIDMPRPTKKLVAVESRKLNKQVTILPSDSQVNSLSQSHPPSYLAEEDDAPELGQTQKQKGIGLRILRNIIHTRNFSQNEKEDPQTEPASVPALSVDASELTETNAGVSSNLKQGRCSVLERLSDFRKDSLFAAASPSQAIPLSLRSASDPAVSATGSISKQPFSDITLANIFAGYSFRALGEAKEGAMLRDAINKRGGRWLSDDDAYIEPDFFLVRLVGGNTFWNKVNPADRSKFRTECWVERSIFEERMCAADEHITFTPLNVTIPVEGSEKLFVSLSGLDSAETYWTKRLLRAVGANVQSAFSKSTSHLICPSGHGEKFQKAQEWKIPVVNLEWLFFIARNGKVPIHRNFEVRNDGSQNIIHESKDAMFLSETIGEEKAVELEVDGREGKIIDITNNHSQEIEPCRPPDPSLRLEETSSVTDCPTVSYRAFIPAPAKSTSSFPPIATEGNTELTFGEPLGLRIPGSPEAIEKNNTRGCSMQPSHPSSLQEGPKTCLDVEMKRTQIPSSCSPSPLRINSGSTRTLSPSISETRVLRTAITALLGKRAPEPKSDESTVQKRPTKRPRPYSRSLRGESDKVMPSLISLVATSSPLSCLSNKEDNITIANEEESPLGVIYEDPDQRDEKRRLIALFEKSTVVSGSADETIPAQSNMKHPDEMPDTSKRKKAVRRSNRSSGGKG